MTLHTMHPATPFCETCKRQFSGNPCRFCNQTPEQAHITHEQRMPSATRRRNRHGRTTR